MFSLIYFLLIGLRPKKIAGLREFFFQISGRVDEKNKEKGSDQLTGHLQSFFLISPDKTVKLVR